MDRDDATKDSELVLRLSHDDLMAFNSLYKQYSGRLYRFAFLYLRNEDESEELVQEVFTIIWEKRSELKEDLSFRSYLFTIAFNLIKKHFRTRSCLVRYFEKHKGDNVDTATLNTILHDSLYQYIAELVNKLPERRREVFVKSRFEGKTISQIADELGISHKTVENQITDALRFLRIHLNREFKQ
jgi:RNA polymerase sigma-70 factor (ECF subfamily)